MRPTTLDEVVGQQHIIGKDKLLYRAIRADQLGSIIFYGPPGTGKTTLAKGDRKHHQRELPPDQRNRGGEEGHGGCGEGGKRIPWACTANTRYYLLTRSTDLIRVSRIICYPSLRTEP